MNKRPQGNMPSPSKLIRASLIGTIAGVLTSGVLLALFSLFCVIIKRIPQSMIEPAVIAIVALSSFIGGYVASRIFGKRGYICGIIVSLSYFLLFYITGIIVTQQDAASVLVLVRFALSLVSGVIGGIMGVGKSK